MKFVSLIYLASCNVIDYLCRNLQRRFILSPSSNRRQKNVFAKVDDWKRMEKLDLSCKEESRRLGQEVQQLMPEKVQTGHPGQK
jgi:Flp pilus assembly secretin CpaC